MTHFIFRPLPWKHSLVIKSCSPSINDISKLVRSRDIVQDNYFQADKHVLLNYHTESNPYFRKHFLPIHGRIRENIPRFNYLWSIFNRSERLRICIGNSKLLDEEFPKRQYCDTYFLGNVQKILNAFRNETNFRQLCNIVYINDYKQETLKSLHDESMLSELSITSPGYSTDIEAFRIKSILGLTLDSSTTLHSRYDSDCFDPFSLFNPKNAMNNQRRFYSKRVLLSKLKLNKKEVSKDDFVDIGAIKKPSLRYDANIIARQRSSAIKKHMNAHMGVDQLGNSTKFERKEKKRIRSKVLESRSRKLKWEHTDKKLTTKAANSLYRSTFDLRKRKNIGVNTRFRSIKPSTSKLLRIKSIAAGKFVERDRESIRKKNMLKRWDDKMRAVFGRKQVTFVAAAASEESIPVWTKKTALPEFAFVGRSNVGKSSLLNAIGLSHKARVDSRPGKTQTINFFKLNNHIMLVDMPGYGFAYSYERDEWYKLTTTYLAKRKLLKRVFVLIDSRHGIKPSDREIMEHLDKHGKFFQVILTKNDLVSQEDLARRMELVEKEVSCFRYGIPQTIIVSSRTQSGLHELRRTLIGFINFQKQKPVVST